MKAENISVRKVNHLTAIESGLPILKEVGKEYEQPLKAIYFKAISDYISVYHPGSDNQNVSTEFIELVFENYYTLNPVDIFAFINYMKLNKPKVSGHKITPTEIIESMQEYIEQRQESFEQIIHNRKFESINQPIAKNVSDALQVFIDKQEEKKKIELQEMNARINEKFEDNVERTKEFERLKKLVSSGEITDSDMLVQWNEFLTGSLKQNH